MPVCSRKISLFNQIIEILEYLKALCSCPNLNISEEVTLCLQKLKNLEDNANLNIRPELQFIVEELQLALMNMKYCRYSPDLITSICVLWEKASSSLYKQIRAEVLLAIPSTRYIKKLTSLSNTLKLDLRNVTIDKK